MYINPAAILPALGVSSSLWTRDGNGIERRATYGDIPDGLKATLGPFVIMANGTDVTDILNGKANADFPPGSWLGFGIDMTAVSPVDITSVATNVLTHTRIIELGAGGEKQVLSGATWFVPPNVKATEDTRTAETHHDSFKTGKDAAFAISVDSNIAARYTAVSGGASASYAIGKTFREEYQYYMFSFNEVRIHVEMQDYGKDVNEQFLLRRMSRIKPFDPRSQESIQAYKSLFATIGSHIITSATYGARLQLTVWASNKDSTVDQKFNVDVEAEFNGLTTEGKVDVDVKGESQYGTFEESVQKLSSCFGGDPDLSVSLAANPAADAVYQTFLKWSQTADRSPNVMSFQSEALWDIMNSAADPLLASRGTDVYKAYQYIVEHPEQHFTRARMVITSDWGEVGLLTPSAYIVRDPLGENPDTTFLESTKISWINPGGGPARGATIDFIIVNDGSPIDISLSHGSVGPTPGTGRIEVRFNGMASAPIQPGQGMNQPGVAATS
ncbi:MAG: hypothetical protein L6R41_003527 [Letrouitia leprolyta]|nr:MAG: hypothetical protein L6R41_003527 [Letrouitia leprolyta]